MRTINYVLIILIILLIVALILWYIFRKDKFDNDNVIVLENYDMKTIVEGTKYAMNQILRSRPEELNLDSRQLNKLVQSKTKLRMALKEARNGDEGAKAYVKDYIMDIIQKKIGINPSNIDEVIPFSKPNLQSKEERFEILLYCYKKKYGEYALTTMISDYKLDELRNEVYTITEQDIKDIYRKEVKELSYEDKLAILCQRDYELSYGNSIIDEYFKRGVDGISGGVSGMPAEMINYFADGEIQTEDIRYSYDSIWLMYKGKPLYMPCIGFGSQNELIRVCRNIHKFNVQKPMTQNNPHIEGEMKDGSRIVVARPPFAESWSFSIRHHGEVNEKRITDIITDNQCIIPIELIEFLVKGNITFLITGNKGTGKTTLLRSVIEFARKTSRIQVQESLYELWLRKLFPDLYITTFRETPNVSGEVALEIGRKWESEISLLGEIVSYKVANWIIQMKQVAALLAAGTHHATTTNDLIMWFRDARMTGENALSSEKFAEQEVAASLNIDIHMAIENGNRYIERVTEIIPVYTKEQYGDNYVTKNIVEFDRTTQSYKLINKLSKKTEDRIMSYLRPDEIERFNWLFASQRERGE